MKYKDLINKTFGDWLVIDNTDTSSKVVCKCTKCGKTKTIDKFSLIYGRSTKCRSCSAHEQKATKWTGNPLRYIFIGMKQRCYDKNHHAYKYYGANGITVCDEWLNNKYTFYEWATQHGFVKGMSIERIDNNKGYSPDNCIVIPKTEQNKNKSNSLLVTFNNETMCLTDACRKAGIVFGSVQVYRSRNKCSAQDAFNHFVCSQL